MRLTRIKNKAMGAYLGQHGFDCDGNDPSTARRIQTRDLARVMTAVRLVYMIGEDDIELEHEGTVSVGEIANRRERAMNLVLTIGTQSAQKVEAMANEWIRSLDVLSTDLRPMTENEELTGVAEFIAFREDLVVEMIRLIEASDLWGAMEQIAKLCRLLRKAEADITPKTEETSE